MSRLQRSRRHSRIIAASVFAMLCSLMGGLAAIAPAAAAPAALSESFTTGGLANPSDWLMSAKDQPACLTALDESQSITLSGGTVIRGCVGTPDASGSGALQLTRLHGYDATTMLYNRELPTAGGLDVSFFIAQYSNSYWGADGISFFTKLGSVTDTTPGRDGGGLGYTGVKGGLFGIGFDAYYNWSQPGELGGGALCGDPSAEPPTDPLLYHHVAVRGPDTSTAHDGSGGYCYITGAGGQGDRDMFLHAQGTRADAARAVRIIVDPSTVASPKIRVYMWLTGGPGQDPATASLTLVADEPAQYRAASTFKFGFSAGTGGSVNIQEVWGLHIAPVTPLASPTIYAVPQSETITAGATPAYAVKLYRDAAHTQLIDTTTVGGYTPPTCTSAYLTSMRAAAQFPISCTGGAAALQTLVIDGTATLTVLAGSNPVVETTTSGTIITGRAGPTTVPWGSTVWDTVTVSGSSRGAAPTGTVTVYTCFNAAAPVVSCTDTATSRGAATLSAIGTDTATAVRAVSGLAAGYYMFYARYSGDDTHTAAAERGTDAADRFQVLKADPDVRTGASETVTVGDLLTLSATLGTTACATDGAPGVSLWLQGNPTSATQPNTDTFSLGGYIATAAKWTGSTSGWQPGTYILHAEFTGSANCNVGASDGSTRITIVTASSGSTGTTETTTVEPSVAHKATGGGWFVAGGARQSFGFQVQSRSTAGAPAVVKGQLQWTQNGRWKFKGTLDTFETGQDCRTGAKRISTCAMAAGPGALYFWQASGKSGKWILRAKTARATILFSATTPSTKKKQGSPGFFAIGFNDADGSPMPPAPPTASTALNALKNGTIRIS